MDAPSVLKATDLANVDMAALNSVLTSEPEALRSWWLNDDAVLTTNLVNLLDFLSVQKVPFDGIFGFR